MGGESAVFEFSILFENVVERPLFHPPMAIKDLPRSKKRRVASMSGLHEEPDATILRLARALARQAAREDHAWENGEEQDADGASRDLRSVFDRPSE